MAWSKVGETGGFVDDSSGPFTWTLPGTPVTGDIVIAVAAGDSALNPLDAAEVIQTAGYNTIEQVNDSNPGHILAYKVMGATPDTTIAFPTGANDPYVVAIQVWRGADAATPIAASRTVATGATGMPDPPAYNPGIDGVLEFVAGFLDDDEVTPTAPSGFTNLLHAGAGLGAACTVMLASRQRDTGSLDPAAFGGSGTDAWRAVTFALRPAAGVVVSTPQVKRWGGVPHMAINRGVW